MYLFIGEYGSCGKSDSFTLFDHESINAGILEVIDISDPKNPMIFSDGEWHDIDVYKKTPTK